ncbi:hypothetical protein E6P97_01045 [Patescibacteria group bacterium]|nr:MAG: hypothetical protein E6P97_01045 [Patescibacteria group bacterium]
MAQERIALEKQGEATISARPKTAAEIIAAIGAGVVGAGIVVAGAATSIGIVEVTSGLEVVPPEVYGLGFGSGLVGIIGGSALMLSNKKGK